MELELCMHVFSRSRKAQRAGAGFSNPDKPTSTFPKVQNWIKLKIKIANALCRRMAQGSTCEKQFFCSSRFFYVVTYPSCTCVMHCRHRLVSRHLPNHQLYCCSRLLSHGHR